jgi:hypothetical protein
VASEPALKALAAKLYVWTGLKKSKPRFQACHRKITAVWPTGSVLASRPFGTNRWIGIPSQGGWTTCSGGGERVRSGADPGLAIVKVKSVATRRFWTLFRGLPDEIQELAVRSYDLWRRDPRHPSLISAACGAVRIGSPFAWATTIAALGTLTAGTITWVCIGTHADYNRLVGS